MRSKNGDAISVVTIAMMTSVANNSAEMMPALEADVDDDQLHQAADVHQNADADRFAARHAGRPGREPAGDPLADHRHRPGPPRR